MSGDVPAGLVCSRCGKDAKLQCPKCLELSLDKERAAFCSQECFTAAWPEHKKLHKASIDGWHYVTKRGMGRSLTRPAFAYTGSLRPWQVGPQRPIPPGIPTPDYYATTYPAFEVESKQQRIVPVFNAKQIAGIRAACALGRKVLDAAAAATRPGVTTDELDEIVHRVTVEGGGYPAPLRYYGFPKSVCTSINEIICHGIPDKRPLEEGDIVNIDVSTFLGGYYGDLNETIAVGKVDAETEKLVRVTYECLEIAIRLVKPGARYRDLGDAISAHATRNHLSVVTSYCGHGIGELFHCAPSIPHYAGNKTRGTMRVGEVFTIEPMINQGRARDVTWPDGWTSSTADGKRSAQFEHQLVVTETGCEVLTARTADSPKLCFQHGE